MTDRSVATGAPLPASHGSAAPGATLAWSEALSRRIREGNWNDQAVSTTRKIEAAVEACQWELGAELLDYWLVEAKVVQEIYRVWTKGFVEYLEGEGVQPAEVASELRRLAVLLAFPDGRPFEPESRWHDLVHEAAELGRALRGAEIAADEAHARLDHLREGWRQLHDRGADFQSGLLTFVAHRFGEDAVGDAYSHVLEPYLEERYRPFDIRDHPYEESLFRNLYLSFEAMRAHLVGSDRTGDIDVVEHDDRVVLSFDPCGSGGRAQRGDPIEGTPSRTEAPYEFAVTTKPHDWAWNEEGICLYCAHCCFALEYWPARQWGHPLRVVDSPRYPDETAGPDPKKCTWTIYKSLEAIPPKAYERIGLRKPAD